MLYQELKHFHEQLILEKIESINELEIITETYLPMMKEILMPLTKSYPLAKRTNNYDDFLDNCLFDLQALRMIAQMCGEMFSDINNAPAHLQLFLDSCNSQRVKDNLGHEIADTTHLPLFINGLEKAIHSIANKPASHVGHAHTQHGVFKPRPKASKSQAIFSTQQNKSKQ
jgi:hypothetical protein